MKKIVTLLLALSMIMAISFALSSCDAVDRYLSDAKEDVITVEDGYLVVNGVKTEYKVLIEDEAPDNADDGDNAENGDGTTEIRTTITAEEFEALKALYNYTCKNTLLTKHYDAAGDVYEASQTMTTMQTEYAVYFQDYDGRNEFLNVLQDGIWYQINDSHEGHVIESEYASYQSLGDWWSCEYTDLKYNEEKSAYEIDINGIPAYFYFENGMPIKIEADVSSYYGVPEGVEAIQTMTFTNIGTTEIEIPEFTIVE